MNEREKRRPITGKNSKNCISGKKNWTEKHLTQTCVTNKLTEIK